jgi:hypothetical protein
MLYTYVDEDGEPSGPPLIEENVRHLFAIVSPENPGVIQYRDLTPELLATRNLVEIKNAEFKKEADNMWNSMVSEVSKVVKFADGGSILGSSRFTTAPAASTCKTMLNLKG